MFIVNSIKNTNPLILHQQGERHHMYRWNRMANTIINHTNYICIPNDITIVTFATKDRNDNSILMRQLKKSGIPYINCTEDFVGDWENKFKIEYFYKKLHGIETKYTLALDGDDVLLGEDLTEIIKRFKQYNCCILYGASKSMYPPFDVDRQDRSTMGEWQHLNAGTMFGETESVRDFYKVLNEEVGKRYLIPVKFRPFKDKQGIEYALDHFDKSEQFRVKSCYQKYNKKHRPKNKNDKIKVAFDYKCRIFQTLSKTEYDLLSDTLVFIGSVNSPRVEEVEKK